MAEEKKEEPREEAQHKDLSSMSKEELIARLNELEKERLRLISEKEQLEAQALEALEKITKWERKVRDLESQASELSKRVEAAEAKMADLQQQHLKLVMDLKRIKERAERGRKEAFLEGAAEIVGSLLPVLDSLEKALEAVKEAKDLKALKEGVEMTYRMLLQTLEGKGLRRIESEGKKFDPEVHECVERVETEEVEEGTIVEEELPGYTFRGKLLRAAKVKVAVTPKKEEKKEGGT